MKRAFIYLTSIAFLLMLTGFISLDEVRGDGGTVGVMTCRACHKDHYDSYVKSTHARQGIKGNPAAKDGCESCHGPGAVHVQKRSNQGLEILIFSKKLADAETKTARCLACHEESRNVPFWHISRHKVAGLSCDNCHTLHSATSKNLKAPEPELCNTCHRSIRAQQNKQSHHPIREGLIKCTDCHDQHGSFGPNMIKADSVNELCLKCHSEKRGPFLWEHPPVEENCLTCHTPHGSNHTKLLNSRPPQLCQGCHDETQHPGTIYNSFSTFQGTGSSKNRMFARGCLNCHTNIHGSNGPSTRGERFVR